MTDNFTKDHLRDLFRVQRENVELTEIAEHSHGIIPQLLAAVDWKEVKNVLSYAPINHEIDPTIFENQLRVAFTHVEIEHAIASKEALIPEKPFDVILVPSMAVDMSKNRLGNGGGWYDRLLEKQTTATSIGIVYGQALVESLPVEEHDHPLDIVVTPTQTLN